MASLTGSSGLKDLEREDSSPTEYRYPLAAAPDIIRSNQKDTYFQGLLTENLSTVLRGFYGVRFTHKYTSEVRTMAELVYLGCTTFIGNRTLGEEYCDIIQVESDSLKLPTITRRSSYILLTIILPYFLEKNLPSLRSRLRSLLESSLLASKKMDERSSSFLQSVKAYILDNLTTLTSPSSFYALSLSVFYFTGAYYHLSKRISGLKYVFTKRIEPSEQRMGYEVLGVLLILQMVVQSWLHFRSTFTDTTQLPGSSVSERDHALSSVEAIAEPRASVAAHTHTPVTQKPRYDLSEGQALSWIDGAQQRKCTLCLEELKDPSVTTCGHVFCWACITDWIREKPECPLCRQGILSQHVLTIRG